MMVGHTKFAPDWAFGLLKQRFKRTKVGCLADLAKVVTDSATINHGQLVGKENGEVIVKQFDWATFSAKHFRRQGFDGIKSLHHLEFAKATPGKVLVRMESDSEVQTLQVLAKSSLHWTPSSSEMLEQIIPAGLPLERSKYLYEKIREFVPVESRDIVCRNPDATPPDATPTSPAHSPPASPPPPSPQPSHSPGSPPPSPSPPPRNKRTVILVCKVSSKFSILIYMYR